MLPTKLSRQKTWRNTWVHLIKWWMITRGSHLYLVMIHPFFPQVKWMMYWIVFAIFTCVETVGDIFISWWVPHLSLLLSIPAFDSNSHCLLSRIPFYYELKIVFVIWLLSPATKGSSILYRKFVHPQLTKREKEIDAAIAKASDQGYSALLSLGSRGFSYATNIVLTTAIKVRSLLTKGVPFPWRCFSISIQFCDFMFCQSYDSLNLH